MMTQHDPQQRNVFEAAKTIADTLAGMQKPEQGCVLRWVAESLGIQMAAASSGSAAAAPLFPLPAGAVPLTPPQAERPKDIMSFVAAKQPKSETQYAAVVAYYYRFEAPEGQRLETINAETLQESTRQSGWKRLVAPHMTLRNAMAQGYIDRAERGEYRINTVGENLVAMTLPGGGDTGATAPRRRGRRKQGAQSAAKRGRRKSG